MRLRFSVATLRAILHLILTLVTFGLWGFVWIGVIALASEKRMSVGIDEWETRTSKSSRAHERRASEKKGKPLGVAARRCYCQFIAAV